MAIITDVIDERSHVYAQQYVNVYGVHAAKTSMSVEVGIHLSEADYRNGIPPHRIELLRNVGFDMDSKLNLWGQAYVAIKQRWPDSTDC